MNRSKFVDLYINQFDDRVLAKKAIDFIFDTLGNAMIGDENIYLRGFGTFNFKQYGPRKIRNPSSGEILNARKVSRMHYKQSVSIRRGLNGG